MPSRAYASFLSKIPNESNFVGLILWKTKHECCMHWNMCRTLMKMIDVADNQEIIKIADNPNSDNEIRYDWCTASGQHDALHNRKYYQ